MPIRTKLKLLLTDLRRRQVKIPYKFRSLIERLFARRLLFIDAEAAYDAGPINARVAYYNKLDAPFRVQNPVAFWQHFFTKGGVKRSNYYVCDMFHLLIGTHGATDAAARRGRDVREVRFDYLFGDITHIPPRPTIVKSRPIAGDNRNSVLLKIERLRHFRFVRDPLAFEQKKDQAVWRGEIDTNPERRQLLVDCYGDDPRCDVAGIAGRRGLKYLFAGNYMEISQQLEYKFIISVEGIDVASNLKWIMSSNSLCFAQRLHYETWFMEGRLIPDFHYALVADDFGDLGEKIEYYLAHPQAAKAIIANAHEWVSQFMDERREDYIGRQVLRKYFDLSGQ